MTKTKTPFFSLASAGSVGDVITTQRRDKQTLVRAKPTPAYRRTLPQLYQRWLYEDYAYLWTQQTLATKRLYEIAARRHKLTGYAYWMKYQLTNLPDIAAWWKLDDNLGTTIVDSSRNENDGTIFGASPAIGRINGALSFDGINDYVDASPGKNLPYGDVARSVLVSLYFRGDNLNAGNYILHYGAPFATQTFALDALHRAQNRFRVVGRGNDWVTNFITPFYTQLRLVVTYDLTTTILYVNGVFQDSTIAFTWPTAESVCYLSSWATPPKEMLDGIIDDVIIKNRCMDPTEILRDSKRSYPA